MAQCDLSPQRHAAVCFQIHLQCFWFVNLGGPRAKVILRLSSWDPKQQMAHTFVFILMFKTRNTQCSSSNSQDPLGVAVGGTLGHCMCTGLAVIGGRMIAQKISVRTGETLFTFCLINNNKHNIFIYTSIEEKNPSKLMICHEFWQTHFCYRYHLELLLVKETWECTNIHSLSHNEIILFLVLLP